MDKTKDGDNFLTKQPRKSNDILHDEYHCEQHHHCDRSRHCERHPHGDHHHDNHDSHVDSTGTFAHTRLTSTRFGTLLQIIFNYLQELPEILKWRAVFALGLIASFSYVIQGGPKLIIAATILAQMNCYWEVMNVVYGRVLDRVNSLKKNSCKIRMQLEVIRKQRYLTWYFLLVANCYFVCQNVKMGNFYFSTTSRLFHFLVDYHEFVCLTAYVLGMACFVGSLHHGNNGQVKEEEQEEKVDEIENNPGRFARDLFTLLAWTHVVQIIIVAQSYMTISVIFEGLIWFVLPITLVTINDFSAYIFGSLYGRTPLTALSPKKTWEGYVAGALGTISLGIIATNVFCHYDYFVCPLEHKWRNETGTFDLVIASCKPSTMYQVQEYPFEYELFSMFVVDGYVRVYPFFLQHGIWMIVFAGFVAPFGGFLASGFKRAFGVKDFSDAIPGHGGIMDRLDCMYLMFTFVNAYVTSFVRESSVGDLFVKVLKLDEDEQLEVFHLLQRNMRKIPGW